MNVKLVRYQLIAFVVVTVLGLGYAMASYVGIGHILGVGQYTVSVNLPEAGGLYANAVVTERGVTVGKVDGLHLSGHGAVAVLSLNDGTQIPSNVTAAVANTSAVGEQYLELTPKTSAGPYLGTGSVIPVSHVTMPPDPSTTLTDLNALLQSVPKQQLNTTVTQLYKAFNGTGPDLGQLLDASQQLLNAAQQNISPTKQLIGQSQPVLATQAANSANIRSFSANLQKFTTQLRKSNGDLTGTLDQAPGLTSQLNDLISQLQPTVPLLLDNLTSVSQVTTAYLPNVRQILVILPADINDLTASIDSSPVPGSTSFNFRLEESSPCTTGYSTTMRQPSDTSNPGAPSPQPYCTTSPGSQQDARGARNDPCPNNPSLRSATAAGCGLNFGTSNDAVESGSGSGYDPSSGLFVGPDGLLYSLGRGTMSGNGPSTLSGLLDQTLGG